MSGRMTDHQIEAAETVRARLGEEVADYYRRLIVDCAERISVEEFGYFWPASFDFDFGDPTDPTDKQTS